MSKSYIVIYEEGMRLLLVCKFFFLPLLLLLF